MKERLSAFDAFFVAYQETSGVLMQLGVEVELRGQLTRSDLEGILRHVVRRWPPLGQRLRRGWFGLRWDGEGEIGEMLCVAEGREALNEWRNRPLDPFKEPPFQLLWIDEGSLNLLAFRAHHAVVDGEGFFAVCVEAVRSLVRAANFAEERESFKRAKVREALGNLRSLRKEAKTNRSARVAMRSCVPGETSIVEMDLEQDHIQQLKRRASELNVAPGWLCASAWMRAIHAWNVFQRGDSTSLISLEVPVSLRRRRDKSVQIGNLISPLTLYGDATQPLDELALCLKQQMTKAMRRRLQLALPSLSAPGRFLPWPIFRKLAANPELTGVATSHFSWFEQSGTIHDEISRLSNGALQLVDQKIYTPVCLHMGAAMSVLAWPERVQIFLTHRLSALSTRDANELLELVVEELGQKQRALRQVAV